MNLSHPEGQPQRRRPNPIISLITIAGVGILSYVGGRSFLNGDNVQRHISPAEPVPTLPAFMPATAAAPAIESVPLTDGVVIAPESFSPPTAQQFRESFPNQIDPPEFILTANDETVRKFYESGKTADGKNAFGQVHEVYRQIINLPHPLLSDSGFRQFAEDNNLFPPEQPIEELKYTDAVLNQSVTLYREELQNRLATGNLAEIEREIVEDQILQIDTYDSLFWGSTQMYYQMVLGPYGLFDFYDKSVPGGTEALTSQGLWKAVTGFFDASGSGMASLTDRYRQSVRGGVFERLETGSLRTVYSDTLKYHSPEYWDGMEVLLDGLRK